MMRLPWMTLPFPFKTILSTKPKPVGSGFTLVIKLIVSPISITRPTVPVLALKKY
jgi:hypothetical protein